MEEDKIAKLRNCPFCGNKDLEYVPVRGIGAPEREPKVRCSNINCQVVIPFRVWNTRASDKRLDDIVEEIKNLKTTTLNPMSENYLVYKKNVIEIINRHRGRNERIKEVQRFNKFK